MSILIGNITTSTTESSDEVTTTGSEDEGTTVYAPGEEPTDIGSTTQAYTSTTTLSTATNVV